MTEKEKKLQFAQVIVDHFAAEIERKGKKFDISSGKKFDRLVAVDDDVFSAFVAAWYYHSSIVQHNHYPKIDVVGGYGLMSSKINPKKDGKVLSEAEMLRYVLIRLGVRKEDVEIVCSGGCNTGQNLGFYVAELNKIDAQSNKILFCLTKRLAGRFYLTQIQQQPQLDAEYIWRDPECECQLYNGKALAGCLPYFSEVASIYDRYLRYTAPSSGEPQFMALMEETLPLEVVEAGTYLCDNFKLKMPEFSWKKIGQFIKTYAHYLWARKDCLKNLEENILRWEKMLKRIGNTQRGWTVDEISGKKVLSLRIKD